MSFIDTNSTRAILIGVSEYQDKSFINASPIKNNITKLRELLLDKTVMGLADKNILVLDNNERHIDILNEIEEFIEEDFVDCVIFYFAGHGYKTDKGKFYLITNNSYKRRLNLSSIPWDEIKEILERGNSIQQRFYILDACHSGAAALGDNDEELEFEDGSALLAAAKAESKAYFNETDQYTYFTEALINILENGVEYVQEPELDVNLVYNQLCKILKTRNFDVTKKTTQKIDKVSLFKNKSYDKVSILLNSGNTNFESDNFEDAEKQFNEALIEYIKTGGRDEKIIEKIGNKIKSAESRRILEKKLRAKIMGEQEEEQKAKETAELKRKLEEERKSKEIAKLKRKRQKERKTLEHAELKLKEEVQKANEHVDIINNQIGKNFIETIGNSKFEMIFVNGGIYNMGAEPKSGIQSSFPVHKVSISDFYICKHLVTQKCWRDIVGNNPEDLFFIGCDNCPVDSVNWYDTQIFIDKLNIQTGKNYRLPSEAEWEFAAIGGILSKGYKYPGNDKIKDVAWFNGNSENKTHPVGTKYPNELGIYDMCGNVYEWMMDKWHDNYYEAPTDGSVWLGSGSGSHRVTKGGSWDSGGSEYFPFSRSGRGASRRDRIIGFRITLGL